MAKNITIREGDTSKQFTAKKLKMNLVGGGTANFVPEDEAIDYVDVKDHEFKENGTFNPSDFNCDAFGQVKVSVPLNVKEKRITQDGVYKASDENVAGYSIVTVATGGGGGDTYAFVHIRFIEGQTVTATDGTTTLISDTSGYFIFSIPNEGVWTFTNTDNDQVQLNVDTYGIDYLISFSLLVYSDLTKLIFEARAEKYVTGSTDWSGITFETGGGTVVESAGKNAILLPTNVGGYFEIAEVDRLKPYTLYLCMCDADFGNSGDTKFANFDKSASDGNSAGFYKNGNNCIVFSVFGASSDTPVDTANSRGWYDHVMTVAVDPVARVAKGYFDGSYITELTLNGIGDLHIGRLTLQSGSLGLHNLYIRYVGLVQAFENADVIIGNQNNLLSKYVLVNAGELSYSVQSAIVLKLNADDYSGGNTWGDFDIDGTATKETISDIPIVQLSSRSYALANLDEDGAYTIYAVARQIETSGDSCIIGSVYNYAAGQIPHFYSRNGTLMASVWGSDTSMGVNATSWHVLCLQIGGGIAKYLLDANETVYLSKTYTKSGDLVIGGKPTWNGYGKNQFAFVGCVRGMETAPTIMANMRALMLKYSALLG